MINLSCKEGCVALEKSKLVIKHELLDLSEGKNPGAVACRDIFQSSVIMLKGEKGDQSFCLFSDGSLLSTKSIQIR